MYSSGGAGEGKDIGDGLGEAVLTVRVRLGLVTLQQASSVVVPLILGYQRIVSASQPMKRLISSSVRRSNFSAKIFAKAARSL